MMIKKTEDSVVTIVPKILVLFDSLEEVRIFDYDSVEMKIIDKRVEMTLTRQYVGKSTLADFLGPLMVIMLFIAGISFFYSLIKTIRHIFVDYKWVSKKEMIIRKEKDPLGEENWDD